jgi:hypothetical protein
VTLQVHFQTYKRIAVALEGIFFTEKRQSASLKVSLQTTKDFQRRLLSSFDKWNHLQRR